MTATHRLIHKLVPASPRCFARAFDSQEIGMAASARMVLETGEDSDIPSSAIMASIDPQVRAELLELVRSRSFRTGTFTLSSGEISHLYFNMKQTMMYPRGAELAARAFLEVVEAIGADYVSGLEMGAVPVIGSIAAISSTYGRPLATTFVRKRAKGHGTKDVIEGLGPDESIADRNVVVIDDVSTTGKSILQAIDEIRKVGGIVQYAACIVNRAEGGDMLLADHGVKLISILHVDEFTSAA